MPSIPTWIPLIERSKHGGIFMLYYKRKTFSYVSQGTVIDSLARKRSKEAYRIFISRMPIFWVCIWWDF